MFKRTRVLIFIAMAAIFAGSVLAAASGARPAASATRIHAGTDDSHPRVAPLRPVSTHDTDAVQPGAHLPPPLFATTTDWLRLLAHDPFYHSFVGGMPGAWGQ